MIITTSVREVALEVVLEGGVSGSVIGRVGFRVWTGFVLRYELV